MICNDDEDVREGGGKHRRRSGKNLPAAEVAEMTPRWLAAVERK